jgi:Spy/CpxP family protein refolding chaperone
MKPINNDFNLIMESWRKYADTAATQPFPLLEQYERKELTEAQLIEAWERDLLLEMQEVFNEGMADTLKQGMAALASGAKEEWAIVKDAFGATMKKINDFLATLVFQALELARKGMKFIEPAANAIRKAASATKKFCSAYPLLCKIVTVLLVMAAASLLCAASAHAAGSNVQVGGEGEQAKFLTDTGYNAIKGCIQTIEGVKTGQMSGQVAVEGSELAGQAVQQLEKLYNAADVSQLQDISGETGELVNRCYGIASDAAAEKPKLFNALVKIGKEVNVATREWVKATGERGSDISTKYSGYMR